VDIGATFFLPVLQDGTEAKEMISVLNCGTQFSVMAILPQDL